MKYTGNVFTGNGYRMKHLGEISAVTLPALKAKASRMCNNYYNVSDRLEVIALDETTHTEYHSVFHRYNKKSPNNEIIRDNWR